MVVSIFLFERYFVYHKKKIEEGLLFPLTLLNRQSQNYNQIYNFHFTFLFIF